MDAVSDLNKKTDILAIGSKRVNGRILTVLQCQNLNIDIASKETWRSGDISELTLSRPKFNALPFLDTLGYLTL